MTETAPTTAIHAERHPESLKDTIESIVVALILAFVFRAFIVEAFVIPTGSMAPTLYGAHGTILCSDCGYEFAYGLRDLEDRRGGQQVKETAEAICPNCRHPNTNLKVNDQRENPERGDRILVLKWPFDLVDSWLGPSRWDVIVFKDPSDGVTNFIKRLAGLPNEVLVILDGDVYSVPADELSEGARAALLAQIQQKDDLLNRREAGDLDAVPQAVLRELEEKLRIARKTPEAQSALWLTVYDHDHPPRELEPYQPRWEAQAGEQSGWQSGDPVISYEPAGQRADYVGLEGISIRASNAYNIFDGPDPPDVSDLRVSLVWTPKEAAAEIHVRLVKHGEAFWATVRADGTVTLSKSRTIPVDAEGAMAKAELSPFVPGRPVEFAFELVDFHLGVSVDGREVVASSSDPESSAYYGPNVRALRSYTRARSRGRQLPRTELPRIYGGEGAFDVQHLLVERDVHYYHDSRYSNSIAQPWIPREGWASAEYPILLRQGEYFMLGDNTAASKDSRLWDVRGSHLIDRGEAFQLGTVPRDQFIGKAFFVYWPSGFRLEWVPLPWFDRVGIIPDVGRMRWIR